MPDTRGTKEASKTASPPEKQTVWLIHEQCWKDVWPVDARELIDVGSASLTGPDDAPPPQEDELEEGFVDMEGPGGRIRVPESEVLSRSKKGFKVVSISDQDDSEDPGKRYSLEELKGLKKSELISLAIKSKIPNAENMTVEQLKEALSE